ncbi:MAG: hypothetical protein SFU27_06030 [Thermonemataceae bacterium]|nr:hypothetical protein [Thermonemataceae bacterium]
MRNLSILFIAFFLFFYEVKSQNITSVKKIILVNSPQAASIDLQGNVYVALKNGIVCKYNEQGDSLISFVPMQNIPPDVIEAWIGVRILLFYRDLQKYIWLNRFMSPIEEVTLDNPELGFVRLLTYADDGNLWLFDEQNFAIKKYNPLTKKVMLTISMALIEKEKALQIDFLREYQHTLWVLDSNNGIFVFDNFGNFKKNLHVSNLYFFTFFEDNIAYIQKKNLYLLHLYEGSTQNINLPIEHDYKSFFLINKEKIFLFTDKEMIILSYYKKKP